MKKLIIILGLVTAFPCIVSASEGHVDTKRYEYTRRFEKVYDVDPRSHFVLRTSFGDAVIKSWKENKVSIVADIKSSAKKRELASEFGQRIRIDVDHTPKEFNLETIYPEEPKGVSFSVDYVITLPATMSADLRNAFGKLSVAGIQGRLKAKTSHSKLYVSDCSKIVRLDNRFGTIRVRNVGGTEIEVENSNGDIEGKNISADVKLYNRFGKVEVEGVTGNLTIENRNGDVSVARAEGNIEVKTGFGRVDLTDGTGQIRVETRNSSVRIRNVAGGYVRNSFGVIHVYNTTQADVGLTVENQNDDVYLDTIKGNVSVSTSFGHIEAADITGNVKASATNSSIKILNPGGSVQASNSFGPVVVRGTKSDVRIKNRNGSIELVAANVGENYRLSTTFAPIKVTFPKNLSASLIAETSFGEIECDYPIKLKKSGNTTIVETTLGNGEAKIEINNQNGAIYINKAQ